MLSWATESLIEDGRAQSDIRQGVTLEVFGEGLSMGPLNDADEGRWSSAQGDIKYDPIEWTTLGEYLEHLERAGVSPNVASFVGAATVREHVLGNDDRAPTPAELDADAGARRGRDGRRRARRRLAALIYAPGVLREDRRADRAGQGGRASAARTSRTCAARATRCSKRSTSPDDRRATAGVRGEIYHLKAAGRTNWPKLEARSRASRRAQRDRARVTANMYTYTAGATGLDACDAAVGAGRRLRRVERHG